MTNINSSAPRHGAINLLDGLLQNASIPTAAKARLRTIRLHLEALIDREQKPAAAQEAVYQLRSTDDDRAWVDCTEGEFNWWQGRSRESRKLFAAAPVAAAPVDLDAHGLRALDNCIRDLRRLLELADDFALDEMQIQSLWTAIESMELRKVMSAPAAPALSPGAAFARQLIDARAENYIGEVFDTERGDIEVTARYVTGKTPADKLAELEARPPAAPGIDTGKLRELAGAIVASLNESPFGNASTAIAMRRAKQIVALIEASPKGGSDVITNSMVDRACAAHDRMFNSVGNDTREDMRANMRAALSAALQATSAEVGA